jgi:hypothetical protein
MEIKRSLNASAKRITPQIEASNTGTQLRELAKRIDELVTYAEAKDLKRAESEKAGLPFASREQLRRSGIKERDHVVAAQVQAEDEAEIAEDQAQVDAQPDVVEEASAG